MLVIPWHLETPAGLGHQGAMELIKDHMLADPALQQECVTRFIAGNFGDIPSHAVHPLGALALPDGATAALYLRHAADAILLDAHGQAVLITRLHNPGIGKLAIPGGFLDEINGKVEDPLQAAIREAVEETGIDEALLRRAGGTPVGPRRYNRPFDIRRAWNDPPGTHIKRGEFFGVSTQGFCFHLPGNLRDLPLQAGDDAKAVQVMEIAKLVAPQFAVPDHLEMLLAAQSA